MKRSVAKQLNSASCVYLRSTNHPIHPSPSLFRQYAVSVHNAQYGGENKKHAKEGQELLQGLKWALASRGVIVKSKIFYNFKPSEINKTEQVSSVPLYIRGISDISKAQFSKLLKQVSSHLSSISNIYVQDGAIGSSNKHNAKVRIISDNCNAVYSLSNILWKSNIRDISHDSCPLIIYIASSINSNVKEILNYNLLEQNSSGFAMADINHSSLILCGKAFEDYKTIKNALIYLASPILSSRGIIPLSARLMVCGDLVNILFAPEDIINQNGDLQENLVSIDSGIILSSNGCSPFFATKNSTDLIKISALIILSSDSTGGIQLVSKVSPGQAVYHFLAGYNDGKFIPVYNNQSLSPVDPLSLGNSLLFKLKEQNIPCFLINANDSGKLITGEYLIQLVESALDNKFPLRKSAPEFIVEDLKGKYKRFLSGKFPKLPQEFSF